jgi:hypothetical protein
MQGDGKWTIGSVFQGGEIEHLGLDLNSGSAGAHCKVIYFT